MGGQFTLGIRVCDSFLCHTYGRIVEWMDGWMNECTDERIDK